MNPPIKVMIVAHPDDEVLWGGKILAHEENWFVLCLTCGSNEKRTKKFHETLRTFSIQGEIWDFPDLKGLPFSDEDKKLIKDRLLKFFNSKNIEKILTHSPEGEYGHVAHKQINKLVMESFKDKEKIHYFHFSPAAYLGHEEFNHKHLKALQIYFNYVPNDMRDYNSTYGESSREKKRKLLDYFFELGQINKYSKILFKFLTQIKKSLDFIKPVQQLEDLIVDSDLVHIYISQFCTTIPASEYKELGTPKNFLEVFFSNSTIYYTHADRRYIILNYLPNCSGKTLSVGCHSFNKYDYACLPNPRNFETIDIDARYEEFGSPFRHTTIDFLNFQSDYKFQDIILFGVLGIPEDQSRDNDLYSLYQRESEVIVKVNSLLHLNGRVLLGPDIAIENQRSTEELIRYWMEFYKTNRILYENFLLETRFYTRNNVVLVLRKIRDYI